jgi:phage/plasmid-like protein (TIGR03299 family)
MSKETLQHLNTMTLRGYRADWGPAWHYRPELQGREDNHYDGPVPVADVVRRLFNFRLEVRPVGVLVPASLETATTVSPNGEPLAWVEQPDRRAITRNDTHAVLGMFKDGYKIHQYEEWLIDTVADLITSTRGDLGIESAGLLRGGAQAWVQVGVPETVHTPQGVSFRPHLLGVTSCDGSIATGFKRCVTLVVCDNTRDIALAETGEQVKVRHSRWSGFKLVKAREALDLVDTMVADFTAEVTALCATTVTDRTWRAFLDAHVEIAPDATTRARGNAERKRDALTSLWNNDRRVSPWRGTAYGVTQAVNTYNHWERKVTRGRRDERNMANLIEGRTGKDDNDALRTLRRVLSASG